MTREQFIVGRPFSVFGLLYDFLVFNAKMDQVLCYVDGKIKDQSFIADERDLQFTASIKVFGVKQPITIQFAYCELKA